MLITTFKGLYERVSSFLKKGKPDRPMLIWFNRERGLSNIILDSFKKDLVLKNRDIMTIHDTGAIPDRNYAAYVFHRYLGQMEQPFLEECLQTARKTGKPVLLLANHYEYDNRPDWVTTSFDEIFFEPIMKVALIACSKTKKQLNEGKRIHASELYVSPLFKKSWAYAARIGVDTRFILSDKYGLVQGDDYLESYDISLFSKSKYERERWAKEVLERLRRLGYDPSNDTFVFLAGKQYCDLLCGQGKIMNSDKLFSSNHLHGIGQILHFLSH